MHRLINAIRRFFGQRLPDASTRYDVIRADDVPDVLESHKIYIVGRSPYLCRVAMLCPCGCGETLHMSLLSDMRPYWTLTIHKDATVSLWPSVWRRVGCRSHFFLRRGRILWYRPSYEDPFGGTRQRR